MNELQKRDSYILTNYYDIHKANRLVMLLHILDNEIKYSDLNENLLELMDTEIVPNITNSIIYIVKKHLQNIYWRLGLDTNNDTIYYISIDRHIDILSAILLAKVSDNKQEIKNILDYDLDDITKLSRILTLIDEDIYETDIYELFTNTDTYLLKLVDIYSLTDDVDDDLDVELTKDVLLYDKIVSSLSNAGFKYTSNILKDIFMDSNDVISIYNNKATYINNILNKIKYFKLDNKDVFSFVIDMLIVNYITTKDYLIETGYILKDFIDDEELSSNLYIVDKLFMDDLYPYIKKSLGTIDD